MGNDNLFCSREECDFVCSECTHNRDHYTIVNIDSATICLNTECTVPVVPISF